MTSRPTCWCPLNNRLLITFYCLVRQHGCPVLCLLRLLGLSEKALSIYPNNTEGGGGYKVPLSVRKLSKLLTVRVIVTPAHIDHVITDTYLAVQ